MMNGLKVLIVDLVPTVPVYTIHLANALDKFGINVFIAGIKREYDYKHLDRLEYKYINCLDLSSRQKNKMLKKITKLIEYLINWSRLMAIAPNYHVIHIQWLPLLCFSGVEITFLKYLLRRNPNVFYTVHNILPHDNYSNKVKRRFRILYNLVPNLVVHSGKTKDELIERFNVVPEKIIVIPHGPMYNDKSILCDRAHRNDNLIGVIGTLRPYKGIEDTIELLNILVNQKGMSVKLLLAGKGPKEYLAKLDRLIESYNLSEYVERIYRYLTTEEMISLYRKVRFVLAPYKRIDQSGAVITALSLGTPVLAYDIGGLSEVVIDKYNGRLIKQNDIQGLVEASFWLFNQDQQVLGKNCLASLDKFSWEKAVTILKRAYFRKE